VGFEVNFVLGARFVSESNMGQVAAYLPEVYEVVMSRTWLRLDEEFNVEKIQFFRS
jgi:hypothetical protein